MFNAAVMAIENALREEALSNGKNLLEGVAELREWVEYNMKRFNKTREKAIRGIVGECLDYADAEDIVCEVESVGYEYMGHNNYREVSHFDSERLSAIEVLEQEGACLVEIFNETLAQLEVEARAEVA